MLSARSLGYRFDALSPSDEIMDIELCRYSGHLAGETCRKLRCAYREEIPQPMIPREICGFHSREKLTRSGPVDPEEKRGVFGRIRGFLGIE